MFPLSELTKSTFFPTRETIVVIPIHNNMEDNSLNLSLSQLISKSERSIVQVHEINIDYVNSVYLFLLNEGDNFTDLKIYVKMFEAKLLMKWTIFVWISVSITRWKEIQLMEIFSKAAFVEVIVAFPASEDDVLDVSSVYILLVFS